MTHADAPVPEHAVTFFDGEASLTARVAEFIAEGLAADEQVIVLATLEHWNAVTARLEDGGIDYGRAAGEGRLVLIDATHVLDSITIDGRADASRFGALLAPLMKPGTRRRLYGEVVSLLVDRGDVDGAVAIEQLGQDLARSQPIRILCGYDATAARMLSAADAGRIAECHERTVPSAGLRHADAAGSTPLHAVRFYDTRESLARFVARFLGEGFVGGLPAIVIATPSHRDAIRAALAALYFDVGRLEQAGDLLLVDARQTLDAFMQHGMPDPVLFRKAIVPLIERVCRSRPACVVRAYGEMVDVLWRDGQTAAAIRLETLWNDLARTQAFALLCGYSMGNFYKDAAREDICNHHTHVITGDPLAPTIQ